MPRKNLTPEGRIVKRLLCPGCVCGHDPRTCDAYKLLTIAAGAYDCEGHVLGTCILPIPGHISLGMPKGFDRPGLDTRERNRTANMMRVRLRPKVDGAPQYPAWDKFNVPVWAMLGDVTGDKDHRGYLFVRTCIPRRGELLVDVIDGGSLEALPPGVVNAGEFYTQID